MNDLTILYLTLNKVPKSWAEYHKSVILAESDGCPIITISKEPMDWGINILQAGEPETIENIARQMLNGALLATTPYVAIVEDDTLYSKEHFSFRPPLDKFAYNMTRWTIFTWGRPLYSLKQRIANSTLIAPRELLIKYLQQNLRIEPGIKRRGNSDIFEDAVKFYTYEPIIQFYHDFSSVDPLQISHRKAPEPIICFDLPKWGRAEELRKNFV